MAEMVAQIQPTNAQNEQRRGLTRSQRLFCIIEACYQARALVDAQTIKTPKVLALEDLDQKRLAETLNPELPSGEKVT